MQVLQFNSCHFSIIYTPECQVYHLICFQPYCYSNCVPDCSCVILASTYGPGPYSPGPLSGRIFKVKCAPRILFEFTLLQEHICYMLLEQPGFQICSWTLWFIHVWSWTIDNQEEYCIVSQICSRSIVWIHTAPGAYLLMLLGQYEFDPKAHFIG